MTEAGRFVTLQSKRVIFIPKGRRTKWADVRDEIKAKGPTKGSSTWKSPDAGTVHRVKAGEPLPSGLPDYTVTTVFDSRDGTWHISDGRVGQTVHADMLVDILRGPGGERRAMTRGESGQVDVVLARGYLEGKTMHVLDLSRLEEEPLAYETDPLRRRRLDNRAARVARKAAASLPRGVTPNVWGDVSWQDKMEEFMEVW